MVVLGGGAASYERDTHVHVAANGVPPTLATKQAVFDGRNISFDRSQQVQTRRASRISQIQTASKQVWSCRFVCPHPFYASPFLYEVLQVMSLELVKAVVKALSMFRFLLSEVPLQSSDDEQVEGLAARHGPP